MAAVLLPLAAGMPPAAVAVAAALAQMPRLLFHRPCMPALPRHSTIHLLGCHITLELLVAQHEMARLLAVVANTVTTLLLPTATTAATPLHLGH